MKHLTIISHTEHYLTKEGDLVGLGSTVTEINHLCAIFDKITHIAMLHSTEAPQSALPYVSEKIEFVALPPVGGKRLKDKLFLVITIPKILAIINRHLRLTDYFQFRAPTGIGVFVIPYLIFTTNKKGWFKYAGNWKQENAPIAYKFQKWCLEHQSRAVTINGFWDDQPAHCLSFENPCMTEYELDDGAHFKRLRTWQTPINFCFVGRLEPAKGIDLLIDAINLLNMYDKNKIGVIHIVGDGERILDYKKKLESSDVKFIFHGYLTRKDVQRVYRDSHAILLPSASEGFPKVIAEAMNYGCLPIVSNVSSIGHYIKDGRNGFLMEAVNPISLTKAILSFLNLEVEDYLHMINSQEERIRKFSFNYYNERLLKEILKEAF